MSNTSFNPITETYTVKHQSDKIKLFENVFHEIANSEENRDLVLLCGKKKLSYHSEVVAAIFPFVKRFVQNAKTCPCSVYIQKKAEIFLSLDGVDPSVFQQMMECIYGNKPMKFSRKVLGEVKGIFKMLGADDKLFSIEKDETKRSESKARVGDVFRNVLGTSSSLDITVKRKTSDSDESERVSKRRVVDINMEESTPIVEKKPEEADNSTKSSSTVSEPSKPKDIQSLPATPVEPAVEKVPTEAAKPQPIQPKALASVQPKPKDANLQMILPHLTVTTIKQEPRDSSMTTNTINPPMPEIKQEPVEYNEGTSVNPPEVDNSMLRCPIALCTSEIYFKTRSEILLHLTQAHYTEGLLELFPFIKSQPCKICVDEKRPKVLIAQIKNRHVAHIGVNHEVVLDLLPAELKEVLMVLPRRIRQKRPESLAGSKSDMHITLDEFPAPAPSPIPPLQSYPSSYNYNYPTNSNYPQTNQSNSSYPSTNQSSSFPQSNQSNSSYPEPNQSNSSYPQPNQSNSSYPQPNHEQSSFPTTTYPPSSYAPYPGYSQYPAYPNYSEYSFEAAPAAAPNLVKNESGQVAVKEESKNIMKEEPKVEIKQEPLDQSEPVYKCSICTARSFNQRSDLLFHLSITHFSRNLNQLYPFKDNQVCSLCNQFKPKNMSSHISHVGLKHEEVIKFLPPDLAATLAQAGDIATQQNTAVKPLEQTVGTSTVLPNKLSSQFSAEKPIQKPTEAPAPVAPTTIDSEEPSVQCSMCLANNKQRLFTKRSEFLKHLSLLHFGKALLQAFPFAEGRNCNLCFETSKKMYTPSKKEVHVCHVGVLHAKIFELLPKEILQQVMEMPTLKKLVSTSALDRVVQVQVQGQQVRSHPEQTTPQLSLGSEQKEGTQSQVPLTTVPSTSVALSSQPQNFLPQDVLSSNFIAPPSSAFSEPTLPANFAQPAPPSSFAPAAPPSSFAPPAQPSSFAPTALPSSFAPPSNFAPPLFKMPASEQFKMPQQKTDKPYNCRYCVSGFDVAKDLKDHLLTHKSQFSQINQTPRKGTPPSSLVHLRMNTPRK